MAGRAHFFDSPSERRTALGLPVDRVELSLNEFTERQIAEYLATTSLSGFVPEWLPSRPLLVGYLAATRVLEDLTVRNSGGTVRRILERLATKARDSQSGLGPLGQESVVGAFRDICGYGPDDHGMMLAGFRALEYITTRRSRGFSSMRFLLILVEVGVAAFVERISIPVLLEPLAKLLGLAAWRSPQFSW